MITLSLLLGRMGGNRSEGTVCQHSPTQDSLFAAFVCATRSPFGRQFDDTDASGTGEGKVATRAVHVKALDVEEGCVGEDQILIKNV